MNTTFGDRLLKGTFWRSKDGTRHIDRRADDDVETKLLTGIGVTEFGYLSASREVVAVEREDGFVATKAAYLAIIQHLDFLVAALRETAGKDTTMQDQYQVVANLVTEYANTLQ